MQYIKTSVKSEPAKLIELLKRFHSPQMKPYNMILSIIGGDIEFQDGKSIVILSKIAASIPPSHVDGLIVLTSGYFYGFTQYIASKIKQRAKPLLGRKYVLIGMPAWNDILYKEKLTVQNGVRYQ